MFINIPFPGIEVLRSVHQSYSLAQAIKTWLKQAANRNFLSAESFVFQRTSQGLQDFYLLMVSRNLMLITFCSCCCFQHQFVEDCHSTISQSKKEIHSDRDCSQLLHTPDVLCTLVAIAFRCSLWKAAQIPERSIPDGLLHIRTTICTT